MPEDPVAAYGPHRKVPFWAAAGRDAPRRSARTPDAETIAVMRCAVSPILADGTTGSISANVAVDQKRPERVSAGADISPAAGDMALIEFYHVGRVSFRK